MKTSELIGPALDWAVAKCEGKEKDFGKFSADGKRRRYTAYSTNWAQGGPIIEREQLSIEFDSHYKNWYAQKFCVNPVTGSCVLDVSASGSTALAAAMRCYVASKLGDEINIPKELS